MGVHGLWRLIEPSGKPVPLETLENKVLAVDISIWLHQVIKGFQDSKGAPIPNAHLLGIFHRICKLLYYRIQPIFVFDGGVPVLKRQTIAKRNQLKSKNLNDANRLQKQILNSLLKHSALGAVITEKVKANIESCVPKTSNHANNDMFQLPPSQFEDVETSSDEESGISSTDSSSPTKTWDLHTIDEKSTQFKSLPADVRHEILTELKDTRKQSSWGRIHELPTESNDFSGYQMKRLLKRHSVQVTLEETEKEMGGHTLSLGELETLLTDHGVIAKTSIGSRIASNENTRFVYIKNIKKALEEAKAKEENNIIINEESVNKDETSLDVENIKEAIGKPSTSKTDIEEDMIISDEEPKEKTKLKESSPNESTADLEYEQEPEEKSKLKISSPSKSTVDLEYEQDLEEAIKVSLQETGSTPIIDNENVIVEDKEHQQIGTKLTESKSNSLYAQDLEEAIKLSLQAQESASVINYENRIVHEDRLPAENEQTETKTKRSKAELEYEQDLEEAIRLSLQDNTKISGNTINEIGTEEDNILLDDVNYMSDSSDNSEEIEMTSKILASAKSYMVEYSGLTPAEIAKIINGNSAKSTTSNKTNNSSTNLNPVVKNSVELTDKNFSNTNSTQNPHQSNIVKDSTIESDSNLETILEVTESNESKTPKSDTSILENRSESATEVIIDSSDSESSDDFLEVSTASIDKVESLTKSEKADNSHGLEIIFDKSSKLEDDLFDDIFHNSEVGKDMKAVSVVRSIEKKDATKISEIPPVSEEKVNESSNVQETINVRDNKSSSTLNQKVDEPKQSELLKDILNPLLDNGNIKPELTTAKLQEIRHDLAKQTNELITERSTKERLANSVTEQMCQEAQELLQLFGVPYVIAPMEAEAQCAFFNEISMTDGTITDDSDIWLFGGKTVYKNFFNQSKHVLEFKTEDIENCFKLSRYEMILLALLVGSDYTTGVQGIGPVTALEIIAAFPPSKNEVNITQPQLVSGLREFRKWFHSKASQSHRRSLRNKLKNIEITEQFPSLQVVQAYLDPTVENSKEPFSWEKPDITSLIDFAKAKFGWNQKKSEEILKPVVKRLEETGVQTKITNYFKTKHKIPADVVLDKVSKRVKKAVTKIGTNDSDSDVSSTKNTETEQKKPRSKGKTTGDKTKKTSRKTTKSIKTDKTTKSIESNKTKETSEVTSEHLDEEIQILTETKKLSRHKIKEMKIEFNEMVLRAEASANAPSTSASSRLAARLHRKEVVPQKQRDQAELHKSKIKAIEVFRKSKRGPGFIKKTKKVVRQPKEDAELSENSDS